MRGLQKLCVADLRANRTKALLLKVRTGQKPHRIYRTRFYISISMIRIWRTGFRQIAAMAMTMATMGGG